MSQLVRAPKTMSHTDGDSRDRRFDIRDRSSVFTQKLEARRSQLGRSQPNHWLLATLFGFDQIFDVHVDVSKLRFLAFLWLGPPLCAHVDKGVSRGRQGPGEGSS